MQSRVHKRLHREYKEMLKNYSDFFRMQMKDDSMLLLEVSFICAEGTVFAGEAFTLQYIFDQNYPTEAPEVIFVKRFLRHEHVHSNGYNCYSILYDEWSPCMRVNSVVISILSMISSAPCRWPLKSDAQFISYVNGHSPKSFNWTVEDDKC